MNSLALINEFLGQPPNASSHGLQIDHILEFCHWFMAALFVVRAFLRFVGRSGFAPFAWYRIAAGFALLAAIASGWL